METVVGSNGVAVKQEIVEVEPTQPDLECIKYEVDEEDGGPAELSDPLGGGVYCCYHCGLSLESKAGLVSHLEICCEWKEWLRNRGKAASCAPRQRLRRPRISGNEFVCALCGCKTRTASKMRNHMAVHTGEKPFKCDVCPHRTRLLAQMNQHKRVHSGEKPYKCDVCDYRAAWSGLMKRHMMRHTGKAYLCRLCDFRGTQKSEVERHMRSHNGAAKHAELDSERAGTLSPTASDRASS